MNKEIRHNGRFIVNERDQVVKDCRTLADKVEDWLNPEIPFRGGHSETNPIAVWKSLSNPESTLSSQDIARIQEAITKAQQRLQNKQ